MVSYGFWVSGGGGGGGVRTANAIVDAPNRPNRSASDDFGGRMGGLATARLRLMRENMTGD
jgi:hypothetical protein